MCILACTACARAGPCEVGRLCQVFCCLHCSCRQDTPELHVHSFFLLVLLLGFDIRDFVCALFLINLIPLEHVLLLCLDSLNRISHPSTFSICCNSNRYYCRNETLPEMAAPLSLWQAAEAAVPLGLLQVYMHKSNKGFSKDYSYIRRYRQGCFLF